MRVYIYGGAGGWPRVFIVLGGFGWVVHALNLYCLWWGSITNNFVTVVVVFIYFDSIYLYVIITHELACGMADAGVWPGGLLIKAFPPGWTLLLSIESRIGLMERPIDWWLARGIADQSFSPGWPLVGAVFRERGAATCVCVWA